MSFLVTLYLSTFLILVQREYLERCEDRKSYNYLVCNVKVISITATDHRGRHSTHISNLRTENVHYLCLDSTGLGYLNIAESTRTDMGPDFV